MFLSTFFMYLFYVPSLSPHSIHSITEGILAILSFHDQSILNLPNFQSFSAPPRHSTHETIVGGRLNYKLGRYLTS